MIFFIHSQYLYHSTKMSKFKDNNENHPNTDDVLSDTLDMKAGPDFDFIRNCFFPDISDEDMINARQEVQSREIFKLSE